MGAPSGTPALGTASAPAHPTLHGTGAFAAQRWRAAASPARWELCLEHFGILPVSAAGCGV